LPRELDPGHASEPVTNKRKRKEEERRESTDLIDMTTSIHYHPNCSATNPQTCDQPMDFAPVEQDPSYRGEPSSSTAQSNEEHTDDYTFQRAAPSQRRTGKNMAVSEAACGLVEPKPVRMAETVRLIQLCAKFGDTVRMRRLMGARRGGEACGGSSKDKGRSSEVFL
jgi:hypothetical protein